MLQRRGGRVGTVCWAEADSGTLSQALGGLSRLHGASARRILCADESCVVTENEWRGTHLGTFLGWPPTGKPVRMRAIVVWHFKGDALWGETIFFDNASLLEQIGAQIGIPPATGAMEPAAFTLVDPPLFGHGEAFE